MGRDSNAYASVAGGSLKLKVDDSGKIKKSKKKKKKKSKNRSRSASPEMGKGLNKIDKEPNYRFAKDIKANVSSDNSDCYQTTKRGCVFPMVIWPPFRIGQY